MSAVLEAREPSARYWIETQPPLVREFDLLCSASDGTARLRELILGLAIRGRLVPQLHDDEPAEELLARLRASDSLNRKRGEVADLDIPLPALPSGWVHCRLDDLAWPQAGFAFKSNGFNEAGAGLPLIRIRDVGSSNQPSTFFSGEFREEFLVKAGEWLISMDGEFRVRRWHATDALLNQRVTRLVFVSREISQDFVAIALQRQLTALQGSKAYTTVDHLSGKQIAGATIALPPMEEQVRIVARVDELMRLCDALEAKGRLEAEQHARLLDTLLGTLTDSTTPEELAANWQRVAAHWDLLLDRPEAVDALEQTVLQLAVRGLVVAQIPSEESAQALMRRITADREARVRVGGLRRISDSLSISEEDHPFELPSGWIWARWNDIALQIGDIDHKMPAEVAGGVPYVSPRDFFGQNGIDFDGAKKIARSDFEALARKIKPVRGDIIYPRYGTIGDVRLVEDDRDFLASYSCAVIKAYHGFVEPHFQHLLSLSDLIRRQAAAATNKTTQPNVGLKSIQQFLVPLPPLAEQRRIVTRVTELRRLCADLRAHLAAQQTVQSQLADALVEQALA